MLYNMGWLKATCLKPQFIGQHISSNVFSIQTQAFACMGKVKNRIVNKGWLEMIIMKYDLNIQARKNPERCISVIHTEGLQWQAQLLLYKNSLNPTCLFCIFIQQFLHVDYW